MYAFWGLRATVRSIASVMCASSTDSMAVDRVSVRATDRVIGGTIVEAEWMERDIYGKK